MEGKTKIILTLLIGLSLTFGSSLLVDLSDDGLIAAEDIYHGTDPFKQDTNGDGLTDYEEIKVYGTDPLKKDTSGNGLTDYEEVNIYGTDPTKIDTDGDGLSDYAEIEVYETSPTKSDSDGDGLSDYNELNIYDSDPMKKDTNEDGLTDYEEIKIYNTDPVKIDTNEDGLSDYDEIKVYETDPLENDTDGDGLDDYEEVTEYGTDPLENDTDDDRLSDYEEIKEHGSDPLKLDTDEDGLYDYVEVEAYGTNPTKKDTNGDGLSDYEEVEVYGTDPLKYDTLGNGINDSKEVEIGTDPTKLDTSGDGYPDSYLYESEELNPRRLNVIVEIQHTSDAYVPSNMSDIERVFNQSPVKSDANVSGINLEIYNSGELQDTGNIGLEEYRNSKYLKNRSMKKYGSHHALFVDSIEGGENNTITGKTAPDIDGLLVESINGDSYQSKEIFMHELGHQLGLWPWEYEGIDSQNYTWSEYPSVMNYNSPSCRLVKFGNFEVTADQCPSDEKLQFSDRDWNMIEEKIEEENPDFRANSSG